MILLIRRRMLDARIKATSQATDLPILLILFVQLVLGLLTIPFSAQHLDGSSMLALASWAQHLVTFQGDAASFVIGEAFIFKIHLVLGLTIFLVFPFTRLVHVWSVPIQYLTRSGYQIVRKRVGAQMSIFVNKVEITDAEIGQEMQYHPAPTQEQAWHMAAQSLVIRQLLLQQAVENGLCADADSVSPGEDEKLIDQLLEQEVIVPEADEATCRRFYDNHPDSFTDEKSGERVILSWHKPIFVITCTQKPCVSPLRSI